MTTTITKTIAVGGAGGANYSSLAAWAADNFAFTPGGTANLVAQDSIAIGQCTTAGGEFTGSGQLLGLNGFTTDATHTITLTTATGQSFLDNAGVRSNNLAYNASNGVGITSSSSGGSATSNSTIDIGTSFTIVSNLQIKCTGGSFPISFSAAGATVDVNNCIIQSDTATLAQGLTDSDASNLVSLRNCLLYTSIGSTDVLAHAPNMYFCTVVAASNAANQPFRFVFGAPTAGAVVIKNCAFFGNASTQFVSSTTNMTFTTCMTDFVGPPTGVTGSLTYASQFNTTTVAGADFREKTGATLQGAGTADSTNGATDISGLARPQGANWDIGAWEIAVNTPSGVPVWLYFGQMTALGVWAKVARDLIRNPTRSRRRFFTGDDG